MSREPDFFVCPAQRAATTTAADAAGARYFRASAVSKARNAAGFTGLCSTG